MRVVAALLVGAFLTAGPALAQQEEPACDEPQDAVERTLALRRELERLLSELSPEERAEFERRWLELQTALDEVPPTSERLEIQTGLDEVPPTSETPPVEAPDEVPATSETPPHEVPPTSQPTPEVPLPEVPPASQQPTRPPRECNTLRALDGNGDGSITGSDRYWRHLYLWQDDGDGNVETGEVERLYELDIRQVDANLRSYTTAKDAVGDVWIDGGVRFDLFTRGKRSGSGQLMIDADGLLRGDDFRLLGPTGEILRGMQRLRPGQVLEAADGTRHRPLC